MGKFGHLEFGQFVDADRGWVNVLVKNLTYRTVWIGFLPLRWNVYGKSALNAGVILLRLWWPDLESRLLGVKVGEGRTAEWSLFEPSIRVLREPKNSMSR